MLERFDTCPLPNSNPVLGLDLRMNYDRDVIYILKLLNITFWLFLDTSKYENQ